ncbi:hypothetical protein ACEN33_03275 [Ruoffia sp. FAM 24228]|uniref:hypothetical protein n=1 Tax=Ruoffia sp. FAM 24228 TaxID=3259517 RepID=UPI00388541D0
MIIPIELRFKADKDSKSAFRTEKTIKSHDVNSVEFHISIDGLELTPNTQGGHYLWTGDRTVSDINAIVTIDCIFASSVANGLTKKAGDIIVNAPY